MLGLVTLFAIAIAFMAVVLIIWLKAHLPMWAAIVITLASAVGITLLFEKLKERREMEAPPKPSTGASQDSES